MDVLSAAALAGLTVLSFLLVRRVRGLGAEVETLSERVQDLAARLDAAERDVSAAVGRTEVAETVLLEKGLADEDDLEAARRRFDEAASSAGDGELH